MYIVALVSYCTGLVCDFLNSECNNVGLTNNSIHSKVDLSGKTMELNVLLVPHALLQRVAILIRPSSKVFDLLLVHLHSCYD